MSETRRRTLTSSPVSTLWSGRSPVARCVALGVTVAITGLAVPAASAALAPPGSDERSDRTTQVASQGALTVQDAPTAPMPTADRSPAAAEPTASRSAGKTGPSPTGSPRPGRSTTTEAAPPQDPTKPKKTVKKKQTAVFSPRSIAAASAQNEINGPEATDCPTCASGSRLMHVTATNHLIVPVDGVEVAGDRTLTLAYESDGPRDLHVIVNGGAAQVFTLSGAGDWITPAYVRMTVTLNKGSNSIWFGNPQGPAPDLDQIRLE